VIVKKNYNKKNTIKWITKICQSCKSFLQEIKWANHARSDLHKRNAIQPLDGGFNIISEGILSQHFIRMLYFSKSKLWIVWRVYTFKKRIWRNWNKNLSKQNEHYEQRFWFRMYLSWTHSVWGPVVNGSRNFWEKLK